MNRTLIRRVALPAALSVGLIGAAVAVAADRETALSAATPTYSWDGGPVTGVGLAVDTDDTLIKTSEIGDLKVSIGEPDSGANDLDLYIWESNAAGELVSEESIASSTNEGSIEAVSIKNLKPGYYLAMVDAFTAVEGHFKGTASLTTAGGEPDPSATPGPTPTPGPGGGGEDQSPDAQIGALKKSYRAKKLKSFKGTASDDKAVGGVEVAVVRRKGTKCFAFTSRGTYAKIAKCDAPNVWLDAVVGTPSAGSHPWEAKLPKRLKKGKYTLFARATDNAGQRQAGFTPDNKKRFKVKK